jgi:hypothetical protein
MYVKNLAEYLGHVSKCKNDKERRKKYLGI